MAADASPSWSGFNYQGKAALYHALKLINAEPVGADFSNYSLMLESIEDFEIHKNGVPVSLHQVKAYNSSSYGKYSDALLGLTLELYKNPNAVGFIHTWKPINSKSGFGSLVESVKNDLASILNEYLTKNANDGSLILNQATSKETGISKKGAILRSAFKDQNTEELSATLSSIFKEENDALTRLKSYEYDNGDRFCDLDDINNKIKSEIEKALNTRSIPVTSEQLKKAFFYFLGLMDRYIILRHKTKKNDEKIPIAFDEIIGALEVDHEDIGNEYLAYEFKEQFAHKIDEYLSDPEDYSQPSEDEPCNLKEASKVLLSLNPQALWALCRSFSPHIDLQHENNTENALDTDMQGIRYVLLKIFHTIKFERASYDASKYKFSYRTEALPYRFYLPTTICCNSSPTPTQIERKISLNPSMCEILFEVENLIYSGSEPHKFSPSAALHTEAPDAENEDSRSKREEILKHITLVPISTAKDALNK